MITNITIRIQFEILHLRSWNLVQSNIILLKRQFINPFNMVYWSQRQHLKLCIQFMSQPIFITKINNKKINCFNSEKVERSFLHLRRNWRLSLHIHLVLDSAAPSSVVFCDVSFSPCGLQNSPALLRWCIFSIYMSLTHTQTNFGHFFNIFRLYIYTIYVYIANQHASYQTICVKQRKCEKINISKMKN